MSTGADKQAPRSLVHGLRLLSLFSAEHTVRGISELAELMGVSHPTAHRYATTCLELGYLEQASQRRYRLAPRAPQLGRAMLDSLAPLDVADPIMRALRERSGRTVSIAVLDGAEVRYLQRLRGYERGQYELERGLGAGSRRPADATAAGRALLAAGHGCERGSDRAGGPKRADGHPAGAESAAGQVEIHPLHGAEGRCLASVVAQMALEITAPNAAFADPQTAAALTEQLLRAAAELSLALAAAGDDDGPAG